MQIDTGNCLSNCIFFSLGLLNLFFILLNSAEILAPGFEFKKSLEGSGKINSLPGFALQKHKFWFFFFFIIRSSLKDCNFFSRVIITI